MRVGPVVRVVRVCALKLVTLPYQSAPCIPAQSDILMYTFFTRRGKDPREWPCSKWPSALEAAAVSGS